MSNLKDYLPFSRPSIDEDTIAGVAEVLRSGWLASGVMVSRFEAALSQYLGGREVRTVTSATAALEIALAVADIGPGDEVVTTPMSWCATANVILRRGARPVFVDVDPETRNLSLEQAASAIGPRTRALVPVHFAGLPVDVDGLYRLARKHNLRVIEDAAHAIGATWRGRRIGSHGDIVCFSFHANKNMTTGEGGAISVSNREDAQLIECHRFHGVIRRAPDEFDVALPGMKANLSDIAARIGLGQLARLEEFNLRRRQLVDHYFSCFGSKSPLKLPARGDSGHAWHLFAPLLPRELMGRDEFIQAMRTRGIGVGVHYPAIHLLSAYRRLGWRDGQFPNAERIGRETITLPLFSDMSTEQVDRVVEATHALLRKSRLGG